MNSDEVADKVEYLQCRVTADMIKSYCGRGSQSLRENSLLAIGTHRNSVAADHDPKITQARNQGGCNGCVRSPPQVPKVHILILNIRVKECSRLN